MGGLRDGSDWLSNLVRVDGWMSVGSPATDISGAEHSALPTIQSIDDWVASQFRDLQALIEAVLERRESE
jgi:hypothetical protein